MVAHPAMRSSLFLSVWDEFSLTTLKTVNAGTFHLGTFCSQLYCENDSSVIASRYSFGVENVA